MLEGARDTAAIRQCTRRHRHQATTNLEPEPKAQLAAPTEFIMVNY